MSMFRKRGYFQEGGQVPVEQTPEQAGIPAGAAVPSAGTPGAPEGAGGTPVGPGGAPVAPPNPVAPTQPIQKPRKSLMDMVEEYTAKVKASRGQSVDSDIPPAMGVDTVPARLAEGEGVLNREATAMLGGESFINRVNADGLAMRDQGVDPNMEPHGYLAPGGVQDDGRHSVTPSGEPVLNMRNGGFVNYFQTGGVTEQPSFLERVGQVGVDQRTGLTGAETEANLYAQHAGLSAPFIGKDPKAVDDEAAKAMKVDSDIRTLITEAQGLLTGAAQAGDFINGHVQDLTDAEKAEVEGAEKSWLDRAKEGFGAAISTAAGAFNQTARVREEALSKIAVRKYPDSYRDYVRLKAIANKMVFPVLESGALGINPTDADVELARQSMFDIKAPSNTWEAQLSDLNQRHGGDGFAIIAKIAGETENADTVAAVASGEQQVNMSGVSQETADSVALADTAYEGEPDVMGSTPENPHKIPKNKQLKKATTLQWLDEQQFRDDEYVQYRTKIGTVAQLRAALTK